MFGQMTQSETVIEGARNQRRDPRSRPKSGRTGTVVPFPGVRYERLENKRKNGESSAKGQAAVTSRGKARFKPDF